MDVHKRRRDFLTRGMFAETMRYLNEMLAPYKKEDHLEEKEGYFESFEKCYPLLSEAGELLMEEAAKQGIQTEGKSKLEIARELFSTQRSLESKGKNYQEGIETMAQGKKDGVCYPRFKPRRF
jgi:hypothetical protein